MCQLVNFMSQLVNLEPTGAFMSQLINGVQETGQQAGQITSLVTGI
jgi:hypothetical protein